MCASYVATTVSREGQLIAKLHSTFAVANVTEPFDRILVFGHMHDRFVGL